MYILGLVILIIGLLISVALHEMGHLLPAKKFGALVPEYWVGFGPTLWSTRFRGTQYGLKAILLGGYVRILGMYSPDSSGGRKTTKNGEPTLAQAAREQTSNELKEAEADGLVGVPFYQLSTPKKLVIMLGGPITNLLLAFFLASILICGIGWNQATTTVGEVVSTNAELGVENVTETQSPASSSGILPGDTILSWSGTEVSSWDELRSLMVSTPVDGTQVVISRGGQILRTEVVPVFDETGTAKIGIVSEQVRTRGNLGEAVSYTGEMFVGTINALLRLPVSLWELGQSFFSDAPRDPNGVVSVVGVARVAGEITSTGSDSGISFADQAGLLISLLASLNMALFVFNLIPLPPLDGGHVVGAIWGGCRNLAARLTGRPYPVMVDTAKMVPLSYAVFGLLIMMTVVLVIADLVKPLEIL